MIMICADHSWFSKPSSNVIYQITTLNTIREDWQLMFWSQTKNNKKKFKKT